MKIRVTWRGALKYALLFLSMALLNYALPMREPLAVALLFAAVWNGFDPFLAGAGYVAASAVSLSLYATLSAALQACFLLAAACVYRRLRRTAGYERALYALLVQLPFLFLFPHGGYALFPFPAIYQKAVLSLLFALACLLFENGLSALLRRALKCRLAAGETAEIAAMWLLLGLGYDRALGQTAFCALTLFLLLLACVLLKNASAVPFAAVLSLPLCLARASALPLAAYTALSGICLLFAPYGKIAASIALFLPFAGMSALAGTFSAGAWEIAFTLLSCALPCLAVCLLPERLLAKLRKSLLFYRERTLPRVAINRNRRAVGEQLYEVSSLFREIEAAFDFKEEPDRAGEQLRDKLVRTLCMGCENRRKCTEAHVEESMDKLIAVGKAKGRVNLIDLPTDLSSLCTNSAGLLFALNRQLAEYRRYASELEAAREGRKLLAEQAHGVSEILREIALEQSEEFSFSDEENLLSLALAREGYLSTEVFLYGEGAAFTASVTLESKASGKRIAELASEALRVPLALSEKLPLLSDRACFILRRKPNFDAAFGVASRVKEGETASGDTHSILRIDERRFIVALSDGMGSGEEARSVSDRTLSLLESFYKAKMPSETVLGTVNRLIAFSSEETFSCLDLAAVDLDTGVADVVKIGSPVGFVLSGETLQVLEGASLPIGALEAVHPATLRVELKENDFLLFMSDGVTSAFGSSSDLCAYLSRLHPLNPQALAEEVLKSALERYAQHAEDDMTVLAVKLTKAA